MNFQKQNKNPILSGPTFAMYTRNLQKAIKVDASQENSFESTSSSEDGQQTVKGQLAEGFKYDWQLDSKNEVVKIQSPEELHATMKNKRSRNLSKDNDIKLDPKF